MYPRLPLWQADVNRADNFPNEKISLRSEREAIFLLLHEIFSLKGATIVSGQIRFGWEIVQQIAEVVSFWEGGKGKQKKLNRNQQVDNSLLAQTKSSSAWRALSHLRDYSFNDFPFAFEPVKLQDCYQYIQFSMFQQPLTHNNFIWRGSRACCEFILCLLNDLNMSICALMFTTTHSSNGSKDSTRDYIHSSSTVCRVAFKGIISRQNDTFLLRCWHFNICTSWATLVIIPSICFYRIMTL